MQVIVILRHAKPVLILKDLAVNNSDLAYMHNANIL